MKLPYSNKSESINQSINQLLNVHLADGYFFRATDRGGTAVNNSLSKDLSEAKINFGETPHSFRVGLLNILNMFGCLQDRYLVISGKKRGYGWTLHQNE